MKEGRRKQRYLTTALLLFVTIVTMHAQDVFILKPELVGQHPRILFTQTEADAHAILAQKYMPEEWQLFINDCLNIGYTTNTDILGQQQWWYFSRLGIGIAMTRDQRLIEKGNIWLSTAYEEEWAFDANKTVDLDVAHKLAGFALLYDCMYNYLTQDVRDDYEELLETGLIKFRTHGYDINDYWTNDYQNNHMHFRATASLYCAAILYDKFPGLQSEYNNVMTVWRRIGYMSPHDGSNHEGLNYSNYGGQMLYPGIYGLKHCTGMDLTTSEHYHNVGYYYIHHLVPGMVSGFGFGDAGNSAASSGPNYLFQIANFTQDPYIQYTAHQLREKHASAFFLRQWFILFNDPLLEKKELTDLPLYRYFDDIGIVISRSDWGPDATAVAFKCGPLGGKLINETRSTEYSWFTDYVNVAHDDPDQGTFLLFSKGSFLTTGDGYEKTDKVTTQHSTFIVDDLTQYGGSGPWCQPETDQSRYAYPKDFFAVDDRVVYTSDMKGVYPDMEKLDRIFVSHQAKYIIIYDNAASATTGRTFEWRLQTEGTLTNKGDKTYQISHGNGSALAGILSPSAANWSTTTNKIGNILRARLSGQKENKYLVILWPNASDLNAISETYDDATVLGVKIEAAGQNEFTLFQKDDAVHASAGAIQFSGNTLLLTEDNADNRLNTAMLVNGDSLSVNAASYFSADQKVNFGIESISADTSEVVYSLGPSSFSVEDSVNVKLGALSPSTTYYLFKEVETSSVEINTDMNGSGMVKIDLDDTHKLILTKKNINLKQLTDLIDEALELRDNAVEGNGPGEYTTGSIAIFTLEIDSAENVLDTALNQSAINDAVNDLQAGIDAFINSVIVDKSILTDLIAESDSLHDEAVEGTGEGEYAPGSKAVIKTAIDAADSVAADTTAIQQEINLAIEQLAEAIAGFKSQMVPIKPKTVFSDINYYGDFQNYTVNDKAIWEVTEEDGNYIVGMYGTSTSRQFILIKDSTFQHFEISFKAKSIKGNYTNDLMIVFGYRNESNYSYAKLSSAINESGVFTMKGSTGYQWILDDYETYGIEDLNWNNYKMVSMDSVLTFYRNGEKLFTVEPEASIYYSGGLGLGTCYRNQAYFDDISVTRLNSTVGLEEIFDPQISIYPNPAHNMLTIQAGKPVENLSIHNILGIKLCQINGLENNRIEINLAAFEQGMYLIRLTWKDGNTGTYRFIKK